MAYNKRSPEIFDAEADSLAKRATLFSATVKDSLLDIIALKEELGQFITISYRTRRRDKQAFYPD